MPECRVWVRPENKIKKYCSVFSNGPHENQVLKGCEEPVPLVAAVRQCSSSLMQEKCKLGDILDFALFVTFLIFFKYFSDCILFLCNVAN